MQSTNLNSNYINNPIYSQISGWNNYNYGVYGPYYPYSQIPVSNRNDDTADTAGKAIFLQGITLAIEKLSQIFSRKLTNSQEFTTHQNVIDTANDMIRKNNLNIHVGYIDEFNKGNYSAVYGSPSEFDAIAKGENAFFSESRKLAVAPKSKPSMILHELGHAINAKGKFTRLLQNSRKYATYAPTALLIANKISKDPNSSQKSFIEKHAAALGFCAFLPTIIEEGLASLRGINAAKNRFGNISNLKILKNNYAIALGTYILAGIGLGIAAKQTIDEH